MICSVNSEWKSGLRVISLKTYDSKGNKVIVEEEGLGEGHG